MMKPLCLSGAARGADYVFGLIAKEVGHDIIHWSFRGHNYCRDCTNVTILEKDQLSLANPVLEEVRKILHRPGATINNPLLQRNYYQVATADSVYAVSSIDWSSKTLMKVPGGTAWTIAMAFLIDVPDIFLFDQNDERWYRWAQDYWFTVENPPSPSGIYAGIGTRELNDSGIRAIMEIYE